MPAPCPGSVPARSLCSRSIDPLHALVVVDASGGVLQLVALVVDVVAHLFVSQVLLQLLPGLLVAPGAHEQPGMEEQGDFLPIPLPSAPRAPAGLNLRGVGAAGTCWAPTELQVQPSPAARAQSPPYISWAFTVSRHCWSLSRQDLITLISWAKAEQTPSAPGL